VSAFRDAADEVLQELIRAQAFRPDIATSVFRSPSLALD
jgi:hypothetical protein